MLSTDLSLYPDGSFVVGYSNSIFNFLPSGGFFEVDDYFFPYLSDSVKALSSIYCWVGLIEKDGKKNPLLFNVGGYNVPFGGSFTVLPSEYSLYFSSFSASPLLYLMNGLNYFIDDSSAQMYKYSVEYNGSVLVFFDSLDEAFEHCAFLYSSSFFGLEMTQQLRIYFLFEETNDGKKSGHIYNIFGFMCSSSCCYPDFSPIVRILGGTPSLVQLENLKSICYLLGVNTAENGLKDCDLMKEYLKRLNQILGGSPYPEPNDNLKSICYLLGVDNSENGLKDCELSKDYVKRNSKMLGAE